MQIFLFLISVETFEKSDFFLKVWKLFIVLQIIQFEISFLNLIEHDLEEMEIL